MYIRYHPDPAPLEGFLVAELLNLLQRILLSLIGQNDGEGIFPFNELQFYFLLFPKMNVGVEFCNTIFYCWLLSFKFFS